MITSSVVQIFELSNGIVTPVFDSIRNEHNYSKFSNTYGHQFLTYLTKCAWLTNKHNIHKGVQENDVSE